MGVIACPAPSPLGRFWDKISCFMDVFLFQSVGGNIHSQHVTEEITFSILLFAVHQFMSYM